MDLSHNLSRSPEGPFFWMSFSLDFAKVSILYFLSKPLQAFHYVLKKALRPNSQTPLMDICMTWRMNYESIMNFCSLNNHQKLTKSDEKSCLKINAWILMVKAYMDNLLFRWIWPETINRPACLVWSHGCKLVCCASIWK